MTQTQIDVIPPLEVVGLRSELGGKRVLDGVDLAVEAGQVTVLIGASGAGKTVLVKHLMTLMLPVAGRILWDGRDWTTLTLAERHAFLAELGVMQQGSSLYQCGLFGSLSVFDNVAYPLEHRTRLGRGEIGRRVERALEDVGLTEFADALPDVLSGGMSRRTALARALISDSRTVIMDDLDSGLDGRWRAEAIDLVREAQTRTGASFLVTTHDPRTARRLADVLALLRNGRIEAVGTPEEVLAPSGFAVAFLAGERTAGLGMDPEPRPDAEGENPQCEDWLIEGRTVLPRLSGFLWTLAAVVPLLVLCFAITYVL